MQDVIILNTLTELKKGYLKVFFWLLFTLFLVPVITLFFAEYGNKQLDQQYTQFFMDDAREQHQDTDKLQAFLQQNPPSSVCGPVDENLQDYKNAVCEPHSELWQFYMMDKVAFWTLIGSGAVLLMVLLFSALAFKSRQDMRQSVNNRRRY